MGKICVTFEISISITGRPYSAWVVKQFGANIADNPLVGRVIISYVKKYIECRLNKHERYSLFGIK